MARTYSVIQLAGSHQEVISEGQNREDAIEEATAKSKTWPSSVYAVVREEDDVADCAYQNGRRLDSTLIRTIIYGLGRFM